MTVPGLHAAVAAFGHAEAGNRHVAVQTCPFLQCSMPSVQWPEMNTAVLMNGRWRTVGCVLIWSVGSLREISSNALTGPCGRALHNVFLFLSYLGR